VLIFLLLLYLSQFTGFDGGIEKEKARFRPDFAPSSETPGGYVR
jgi:hypothetical protein